ncbi:uncharacterized protein LOC135220833 isoform X1 [Macrobrachium nipponense]|uniref:uncharacterized protein LOC135220833 isoform X1 n=1 Tax=Macrobrachium nipponense TaxID=159736 RepID=UPI0030C81290
MEPATYQIPLVVLPQRQHPWQRLYTTATHSSAGHARAVPQTYASGHPDEEEVKDSLEWTLRSSYDHENDLFIDKSTTLRRPGNERNDLPRTDKRRCQKEKTQAITRRDTSQVLRAELEAEAVANGRAGMGHIKTWRESPSSGSSSPGKDTQRSSSGPKVVTMRTRDSLTTSLLYSPRPTHTLTVPKVTPGYARNPTGSFFTS